MFQNILNFLATKEGSGSEVYYSPTLAGNILLFVLVVILFITMAALSNSKSKVKVQQLAFSAMAVTLAVVTSFITFAKLPFGGSITLFSMLFIVLIGYLYGTKAGVLTGIAYGFINMMIGPTILHPVQMLLDYPIAFGCLGLSGAFSRTKYGLVKGYILGVFGRYICHVISGFVFFSMYTPKGMNSIVYSFGYNATYIVPEAIATLIILFITPVRQAFAQVKGMAAQTGSTLFK